MHPILLMNAAARHAAALATGAVLLLAGCASLEPPAPSPSGDGDAAQWRPVTLPGKARTHYAWTTKDGEPALAAVAERSVSLMRRDVPPALAMPSSIRFAWWVDAVLPGADVSQAEAEDAPARIVLAFDGDASRLSARNRLLFDLAETMTGERPPYATLMYVFGNEDQAGQVVVNPRSDRIRKIVVDGGAAAVRRWRRHQRDVAADFRRAFGEEPGPLKAVAVMTDADNTRQTARAWYGRIVVEP